MQGILVDQSVPAVTNNIIRLIPNKKMPILRLVGSIYSPKTRLRGIIADMQWSMNLHPFAPICTYAAYKMHENKQTSMENIYI